MDRFEALFNAAGNDYQAVLGRADGDVALVKELMLMFTADENMEKLSAAISSGDADAAFRAAHSLKGSSGMLGMLRLHTRLCGLTEALRRGDVELAQSLYPDCETEYGTVMGIIRAAI